MVAEVSGEEFTDVDEREGIVENTSSDAGFDGLGIGAGEGRIVMDEVGEADGDGCARGDASDTESVGEVGGIEAADALSEVGVDGSGREVVFVEVDGAEALEGAVIGVELGSYSGGAVAGVAGSSESFGVGGGASICDLTSVAAGVVSHVTSEGDAGT